MSTDSVPKRTPTDEFPSVTSRGLDKSDVVKFKLCDNFGELLVTVGEQIKTNKSVWVKINNTVSRVKFSKLKLEINVRNPTNLNEQVCDGLINE